ncbi:unnamed protein product [Nesidiocoris tenuis]|uniref:Uncharacterized protein n=1 Tax=Nesidiocoris tenuis TaxID=355587 RepID=A0A6H5FWK5_9HEMI|nr:unnamed protein product [Nesidiocoris tenuis]
MSKNGETEQIVATIISIFHQIPAAGPRFIEPLSQLVLQTERNLLVGASSPFRHPLLKFLLRYPQETVLLLLSDNNIKRSGWNSNSRAFASSLYWSSMTTNGFHRRRNLPRHTYKFVFRSLLKAHAVEVRPVVRQALEILTPAMPARMEDGYRMLTHWTKKIIVEEGHSMQQLFHILQLVVRHYAVYYPVRHNLLRHMVTALQRLGFSASSSLEHKKLGCELAEIIIRWEHQRIKDENLPAQNPSAAVMSMAILRSLTNRVFYPLFTSFFPFRRIRARPRKDHRLQPRENLRGKKVQLLTNRWRRTTLISWSTLL